MVDEAVIRLVDELAAHLHLPGRTEAIRYALCAQSTPTEAAPKPFGQLLASSSTKWLHRFPTSRRSSRRRLDASRMID
ncbi:hypothetical protein [Mycobacterium intracellulare]|uniref:hypothetical protein n=1 Tax=Mycobacterium intracellulare TaxID=1767 RepID=UPI000B064634|nr:hypothetical protein [Mycobacterium intracellulare]MDM3908827.1 hypothetical protein [Mycobacterium intracellulare subsp. chimaera]